MTTTLTTADRLGRLSCVISVPWEFQQVRLYCCSCAREDFMSNEMQHQIGDVLRRRDLLDRDVVEFARDPNLSHPRIGLILPFDPLAFRGHLLHEVRPEIDSRYLGKPVQVQDMTNFTKKKLSVFYDELWGSR